MNHHLPPVNFYCYFKYRRQDRALGLLMMDSCSWAVLTKRVKSTFVNFKIHALDYVVTNGMVFLRKTSHSGFYLLDGASDFHNTLCRLNIRFLSLRTIYLYMCESTCPFMNTHNPIQFRIHPWINADRRALLTWRLVRTLKRSAKRRRCLLLQQGRARKRINEN